MIGAAAAYTRTAFRSTWSGGTVADDKPEVLHTMPKNPSVQQLANHSHDGLYDAGQPIPTQQTVGIHDALFHCILDRDYASPPLTASPDDTR